MARRDTGKYPEQIVIMSKRPQAQAVREQAKADDESVAGIGRRWLGYGERLERVAKSYGCSVESILDQVERTYVPAQ